MSLGPLLPFAFEHEVEHGLVVRALTAKPGAIRGGSHLAVLVGLGLRKRDPRPLPLRSVGGEQGTCLEPPLVVAEPADVENVSGTQREPVEHHAVPGVRVLASDLHVDLADPIPLPLAHVVDEVKLPGLLEKSRISPDVSKHESPAAIDVADQVEIGVHLCLVERLAPLELEVSLKKLGLELAVPHERNVADVVAGALADDVGQVRPVAKPLVDDRDLAAHLGLEEAQAAVVGGEGLDVAIDLLTVYVTAEKP